MAAEHLSTTNGPTGPVIPWEDRDLSISEFAALCRAHCRQPATLNGTACGSVDPEHGEPLYRFCVRHGEAYR